MRYRLITLLSVVLLSSLSAVGAKEPKEKNKKVLRASTCPYGIKSLLNLKAQWVAPSSI